MFLLERSPFGRGLGVVSSDVAGPVRPGYPHVCATFANGCQVIPLHRVVRVGGRLQADVADSTYRYPDASPTFVPHASSLQPTLLVTLLRVPFDVRGMFGAA